MTTVKQMLELPLQYVSDGQRSFFSNGRDLIGGFNTWKKRSSSITSFPSAELKSDDAGVCSHGQEARPKKAPLHVFESAMSSSFYKQGASLFDFLGIGFAGGKGD